MKQKHIPLRKCTGCGEMKEKHTLIRVVKSPDITDDNGNVTENGTISLDLIGKKPGRGAYICRNEQCLNSARKSRRFERTFSCRISDEIYNSMLKELSGQGDNI